MSLLSRRIEINSSDKINELISHKQTQYIIYLFVYETFYQHEALIERCLSNETSGQPLTILIQLILFGSEIITPFHVFLLIFVSKSIR